ncbi:MAG: EAL domain-containing protein [Candidatus Obscuribacterales bacterium]|nr:EAL domain-containing protein [Steroidobacteraceae bacterium]
MTYVPTLATPSAGPNINELLARAHSRLNCFAIAYIGNTGRSSHFYCSNNQNGDAAKAMIERATDSFVELCRDKREPIIRNRVRSVADGPLVCRFLVAPVRDDAGLLGVLVMYNHANGVEFNNGDAQMATTVAHLFSRAASKTKPVAAAAKEDAAPTLIVKALSAAFAPPAAAAPPPPKPVPAAPVAVVTPIAPPIAKVAPPPSPPVAAPPLAVVLETPGGLLTRAGFEAQVSAWRQGHQGAAAALLYGNIDQMHLLNDLWGFKTGDRAIATVGEKLRIVLVARGAILCKLSADRFAAFMPNCTVPQAHEVADAARVAIAATRLTFDDQPVPLSMSWGVAPLTGENASLNHVLAAAEIACKAAKDFGRNRVEAYQNADSNGVRRHNEITAIGRLRTALDEDRLRIFAQPISSLVRADDVTRYEMLARILDENDKLVLPKNFMSAATRYQLLPQLDRAVITHVLSKLKWAQKQPGFKPLKVAINLSGPTINEPDFIDWLVAELDSSGVPGEYVGFELTETAAVSNLDLTQFLMVRLGAKGCKFSLDHFGTGLSSLKQFQALNPSTIKIDGSFIHDLLENKRAELLVRAISQMASAMGIETVAEYVETPAICMRLIELGVHFGQGYAIGKPISFDLLLNPSLNVALAS